MEERHIVRQLLQGSVVAVVAMSLVGDVSSAAAFVGGAPALATLAYSRDLERQADEYAFTLLRRHGISPGAFAALLQRLGASRGSRESAAAFLSTHPLSAERIERAKAAARP